MGFVVLAELSGRNGKKFYAEGFDGVEHELDRNRSQQQAHDANGDAHHDGAQPLGAPRDDP